MKRQFALAMLSVFVAFLGVGFWTSTVFAQRSDLYLPLVGNPEKLGTYPEIQPEDCEEIGLAISRRYFSNGTPISEVASVYHMFALDLYHLNWNFFPEPVIDSITGHSRVCLYRNYDQSYFPNFANSGESLVIKWHEGVGVPEWEDYLWTDPQVTVSQAHTETYTILFGMVAIESAWGAPVVGTLELGGKPWGQIIKGIPSNAVRFMGNAVSGFVLLDALYERISTATTLGVEYSATVLTDEGAGIFYGTQETEWAYFGCYANGTDIYQNLMSQSNGIRMYTTGTDKEACIISRVAIEGEMGGLLYPFEVLHATALHVVAEQVEADEHTGPTTPIEEKDVKSIADAFIQWSETMDDDPDNDPIVPPPVEDDECPRLANQIYIVTNAVYNTVAEVQNRVSKAKPEELPRYKRLMDFADWAEDDFIEMVLQDRYESPRPRRGLHTGHMTSENSFNAEPVSYHGTVEAVCTGKLWIVDPSKGRLRTGLTSTIWDAIDYIRPYQYEYDD